MATKLGKYLNVPVGSRYRKKGGVIEKREYASRMAQTRRAEFDLEVARQYLEHHRDPQPGDVVLSRGEQAQFVRLITPGGGCVLRFSRSEGIVTKEFATLHGHGEDSAKLTMPPRLAIGDEVLSHGTKAELVALLANGGCRLTFAAEDGNYLQTYEYPFMFGHAVGSARIVRQPPLLSPPPRSEGRRAVKMEARRLVRDHAKEVCPISPCKRDCVRRHTGPRLWEDRQVRADSCFMLPAHSQFQIGFRQPC